MNDVPQEVFDIEGYKDILAFALKAHGEQKTPHNLPYSYHIVSVATEVISGLSVDRIPYDEANIAIACALLHDVNEDTDTDIETLCVDDVSASFAHNLDAIKAGVRALTKDESLGSKALQMDDSLKRLLREPKCVQLVKLADRIVNLGTPPPHWNRDKIKRYQSEAQKIHVALKDSHQYLANRLKQRIDAYDVYLEGAL